MFSLNTKIESLFSALVFLPKKQRAAKILELCPNDEKLRLEIESLLIASDKSSGFLSVSPLLLPPKIISKTETPQQRILGPYEIQKKIGSGGMGTVYLAQRIDGHYEKKVAIKIANQNIIDTVQQQRFITERQILATLEHPNIARLLDGASTMQGHPYIVMEYIDGIPINTYCGKTERSIREKVQLFCKVCAAVQYAHQNQIVHRDLKPANILVTVDNEPKLIDFGIAKLLGAEPHHLPITNASGMLMTPEYAAPEQVHNVEITPATDVYALGIVLFELLCNRLPFEPGKNNLLTMLHDVCEKDAPRASDVAEHSMAKQLKGDLDNIIAKALSKDPKCRYTCAGEMANDLCRYIMGCTVSATNHTFTERIKKYCLRNKPFIALSNTLIVLLTLGTTISTIQWGIAQMENKHRAEQRLNTQKLASAIVNDISEVILPLPTPTLNKHEPLKSEINSLEKHVRIDTSDPNPVHDVSNTDQKPTQIQGNFFSQNIGNTQLSLETLLYSIKQQAALFRKNPQDTPTILKLAKSYRYLGTTYGTLGNIGQAIKATQQCANIVKKYFEPKNNKKITALTKCYLHQAHWYNASHDTTNAQRMLQQAENLAIQNDTISKLRRRTLFMNEWSEVKAQQGDYMTALRLQRRVVNRIKNKVNNTSSLASAYHTLGQRLQAVDQQSDAAKYYQLSQLLWRQQIKKFPEDLRAQKGLADILTQQAHYLLQKTDSKARPVNTESNTKACAYLKESHALNQPFKHKKYRSIRVINLPDIESTQRKFLENC
ncbi:MAG: serine/threonine protein kinase [Gammaproteobacteria bacterium]|nr:serine/threonine protein kinase [Gammaproteobacteria bacterium]